MACSNYFISLIAFVACCIGPSTAQSDIWADYEPAKNWTDNIKLDTKAQMVLAHAGGGKSQLVAQSNFNARAEWVGTNGLKIGTETTLRLQKNNDSRVLGNLNSPESTQNSVVLGGGSLGPDDGSTFFVERARLDVKGNWGEMRLGIDQGAAAEFYHGPEQVYAAASLDNASLHPDGNASIKTKNGLTANLPKLSYHTPRWLGFKFGASLSQPANLAASNSTLTHLREAEAAKVINTPLEFGADYQTKIKSTNLRFRTALSSVQIDAENLQTGIIDTSRSNAISGRVEGENWSIGLAARQAGSLFGEGKHTSAIAGLVYEPKVSELGLKTALLVGQARDDALDLDGNFLEISTTINLAADLSLSVGLRDFNANNKNTSPALEDQQNIVMELSLNF